MRLLLFIIFAGVGVSNVFCAIHPQNIKIIRDQYGVPHIYAPTDEEVAYGLAWATAEDDFASMQENFMAIRGKLASVKGKDGAMMDFMAAFIGAKDVATQKYDTSFSPKFKKILAAYTEGVNQYIALHPDELYDKSMPKVTPQDIIAGYVLGMVLMTNVYFDIINISNNRIFVHEWAQPHGSNGIAVSGKRTDSGQTFLAINSHQPLSGPYSWYEAHLHSDEGWNMLGATFPGGVTLFHGVNENLGWAHTVNFNDLCDTYKLTMHPYRKLYYKVDDKWLKLEERKVKMKVKVWIFQIPVTKTFYQSIYGPTLKNKQGYYAMRFPANMDVRAAEQWYKMNKSKNMHEFMQAIEWHAFAGLNIVYADKESNIMMYDNNQFPKRNPKYNWKRVVPGNTLATLWHPNDYYCLDSLQKTVNPEEGFVFNCNNTAFNTTGYLDKWSFLRHPLKKFYFPYENNRSLRFSYLFNELKGEKISWQDFLRIKYDQTFQKPYYMSFFSNMEEMLEIPIDKYPELKDMILQIHNWNGSADVDNTAASIIALLMAKMSKPLIEEGRIPFFEVKVKEKFFIHTLTEVKKDMIKYFGSTTVPLGRVQKLVRGDKVLPMSGITDVIAAMSSVPYKKGMLRADVGETYIALVRFTSGLPIIESVSPYGSSNVPGSKHYDDQMELFVNKKRKNMSMDYVTIVKSAEKIYNPG